MNPTHALLSKDNLWTLALTAIGAGALLIAYSMRGFDSMWMFPPRHTDELFATSWIAGLVLGIFAGVRDEVTGTSEYLFHRPLSQARIHAARIVNCAIVLFAWFLVPPIAHWVIEFLFGDLASFGMPSFVLDHWTINAVMVSACAVGLFASTIPTRSILVRVLAAGTGILVMLSSSLLLSGDAVTATGPWLLVHAAITTVFLAGSFANVGKLADDDRPMARLSRVAAGSIVALTVSGSSVLGIALLQEEHEFERRQAHPRIVQTPAGTIHLCDQVRVPETFEREWLEVNEDHVRTGTKLPHASRVGRVWPGHKYGDFGLNTPRFRLDRRRRADNYQAAVDTDTGLVHVAWSAARWSIPDRFEVVGRSQENERFSDDARILHTPDAPDLWIVDSGALWRLRSHGAPRFFQPVALPDGDRLREHQTVHLGDRDILHPLGFSDSSTVALIGDKGVYVIGDELRAAPKAIRSELVQPPSLLLEAVDPDPITPTIAVVDADGEERFRHTFELQRFEETAHGVLTLFWSLLRPPAVQAVTGSFGDRGLATGFSSQPFLDPLVADRRRAWLTFCCIAVGLLCAFGTHRMLCRRDVDANARRFWIAWSIVLGPAGLLSAALFERRRAHADRPVLEIAPPLIRSA